MSLNLHKIQGRQNDDTEDVPYGESTIIRPYCTQFAMSTYFSLLLHLWPSGYFIYPRV